MVAEFGADTLRLYIMFLGDFEKAAPWSSDAVKGCKRFLDRIWNMAEKRIGGGEDYSAANEAAVHRTIKKVGDDIDSMKFNTAIAALMTLVNQFSSCAPSRGDIKALLALLSPFAPHIAEELWELQDFKGYACQAKWPAYDESKTAELEKEIAIQINGKLKSTAVVPADADEETVKKIVMEDAKIRQLTVEMQIVRVIVVKNKLVNLVVRPK